MREFDPKYPEGIDAEFNELERERQEWEDLRAQERDIESRLERERERNAEHIHDWERYMDPNEPGPWLPKKGE